MNRTAVHSVVLGALKSLAALLLACGLSACSSAASPDDGTSNLPALGLVWSLPEPRIIGYTQLSGDLLLGPARLKAIDVRTRTLAFTLSTTIKPQRTGVTPLGDRLVALTGRDLDLLTVLDRTGAVLNTVPVPGGTHQGLGDLGPVVAGSALYVVSGATVYKFATADLLSPAAKPVWRRTYPGYSLTGLAVQDENRLYVSTNASTSQDIVALDGQGRERWKVEVAPPTQTGRAAYVLGLYKDTIIAQAGSAGLQAYRLDTGERAWADFPDINICPGGSAPSALRMTIAADKVFLGPWGGTCVLAFQADTGQVAWVFDAPNRITFNTTPLYLNGVVYASNSRLWALDAETGRALAVSREEVGDNVGSPLSYDAARQQLLHWGSAGLHAYRALK